MDINKILNSDYLDILFEGRNKSYGGYELRKNYPKRVKKSLFILAGLGLAIAAYAVVLNLKKFEDNKKLHPKKHSRLRKKRRLIQKPLPYFHLNISLEEYFCWLLLFIIMVCTTTF